MVEFGCLRCGCVWVFLISGGGNFEKSVKLGKDGVKFFLEIDQIIFK